jgi:DTW domain-containing protein YfiP
LSCEQCQRPQGNCLCAWITPTTNRVPVLLLQHPLEVAQAKGSARLLRLSLGACQLVVGESFAPALLQAWLGDGAALLYPAAPGAPPAPRSTAGAAPAPTRLVVLDGTWRKTLKMLHHNPLLQTLPRCPFPGGAALPPSRYGIRKAQQPWHRSTLEATCLALGGLEGRPAHYAPLLQAFDGWVQAQMLPMAQRPANAW